ncbi:MAG: ATP-binding protein [Crocosphaera sp.]|nr:ATP-binding protein [Crocosphaera sp.]
MLTLKDFLHSVPIVTPPITSQELLNLFKSHANSHDGVVLVNQQGIPLGIIFSRDFYLSLLEPSSISFEQGNNKVATKQPSPLWHWENCLTPLTLIHCALRVSDFADRLRTDSPLALSPPTYGLVDERGKFLGLLNSWRILQGEHKPETKPPTELASAKQLLKELLEELPLPVMLQTNQGDIIQQNRVWREQIGELIPPDDATACPLPQEASKFARTEKVTLPQISPIEKEKTKAMINTAFVHWLNTNAQTRKLPLSEEPEVISPSLFPDRCDLQPPPIAHQNRAWQFIKCPLRTDKLSIPISIFVATDVTQQQQLCQELAAKNADLVQLNRLKDEFLACISHELKSPLTAVVGLSSLLQEKKIGELNPRQIHYAQLIYRSGRQLMTLVNDLLDLTRLETGQLKLSFLPVNIKSICARAYHSIVEKYQSKRESPPVFSLEIEEGLHYIVADELRLHQMLVHLLDNAMKFTQTGGEIGLKVNRWQEWLAFTVWDTGIGIPEESQHLIFQKFQQLENPLTRQFEGTGLGLVLTQRLARCHGGDISFVSKVDQGSQFTLLLPPSPDEKERAVYTQSSHPLILIVEAIPQSIEDLRDKLTQLGYHVIIARAGTEAVEKARQLRPQAIFLNPLLPLLSGWDVLTLLKSDPQTQKIPVFLTQTEKHQIVQKPTQADGFIQIPADSLTLQHCLNPINAKVNPTQRPLTILGLIPNCSNQSHDKIALENRLEWTSMAQLSQLNHRILEADDLEQASLLVAVWDIDVVVLDGQFLENGQDYLRSLADDVQLSSLPLVVLDVPTAELANQIDNLSVFPCLISDSQEKMSELWQVISIAAEQHQ